MPPILTHSEVKDVSAREPDVVVFLRQILKNQDGEMPLRHLIRQLSELPIRFQHLIGDHKKLFKFLAKHHKHFTVRYGVLYIVKNELSAQYGRIYTDVVGEIVGKRQIHLLNSDTILDIPKLAAEANDFQIGALVKCNATRGGIRMVATEIREAVGPDTRKASLLVDLLEEEIGETDGSVEKGPACVEESEFVGGDDILDWSNVDMDQSVIEMEDQLPLLAIIVVVFFTILFAMSIEI